jgi:3-hydroxyacyl-[acyl-carrier-protein] dehydratase
MSDSLAAALNLLPHGPDFRFVDRLTRLEPGRGGAAEYTVRGDESFLRGHFPREPIFPGVLLIEAATQLAGVVAQSDPDFAPLPGLKLTAVRAVKIFGSARPGELIQLEARNLSRLGRLVQADVIATVNGKVVLQGQVTLGGANDPF